MNTELNELRQKISVYAGGMSAWCRAYGRSKPTFYLLFTRKKITKRQDELCKIGKSVLSQLQSRLTDTAH
jgi:hypothetical protein